jgi:polar amino acid transport system permease protein
MGYQFDFSALSDYSGLLARGTAVTLGLTMVASVLGILLGIGGAAGLLSGNPWLKKLIGTYVELIRNTPFIVQMFFVFYGLPGLGFRLSAVEAAILAMTINVAAYATEILRAGIEAVPHGQLDAGRSVGMRPTLIFGLIVLPQAIANVYPALVSQVVIVMLESAVVSQIAVVDLTHVGDLIQSRNFRAFETYFVITLIYLGLALVLRRLLAYGGLRLLAGRVR